MHRAQEEDPEHSFQLAIYHHDELIVDLHAGEGMTPDSLMIPMSVSKNSLGFVVALLLDRGELDLDAPVSRYWPEFGVEGKAGILVRELLSHQAGLPEAQPPLTDDEYADLEAAAGRLVTQLPWWRPGATFGYHGLTIGVLGAELVRRVTGTTFHEVFEQEVRAPRGLDFYVGLPPELEDRVLETQPMRVPDGAAAPPPFERSPGQVGREVFAGLSVQRSEEEALARSRRSREIGNPAAFATVSARGIAGLFAECTVGLTGPALVSEQALARVAQLQVAGTDAVIGIERRYGVVFQKPSANLPFGSHRAFGHDGAGGGLGFHDPRTRISFGYSVRRTPFPGGADARALDVAYLVHAIVDGSSPSSGPGADTERRAAPPA
ncbi:serine hydrolase domain-containing protein [Kineococcus esterisolvens]|uniref:serine hydrolase domain-containing protein n=1 Tax=unclassified Kineococcus TaxID=2621656 RepID=UPI003D7C89D5